VVSRAGPIPARSLIKKKFDLGEIFSSSELKKAFSKLRKKRRFKTSAANVARNRYVLKKESNALGRFVSKHNSDPTESIETYVLSPYHGIKAVKKNGKFRPLLVPIPQDRQVFIAALPRVKKLLEGRLLKYNALGVGVDYDDPKTIKAICREILKALQEGGKKSILALDFKDFFSSINRKKLDRQLRPIFKKANEEKLYSLVRASVNNELSSGNDFEKEFGYLELDKKGIPQGLAYSPLLASFFGIKIDRVVAKHKSVVFYRYLDDMIVLADSEKLLISIYQELKAVSEQLGLTLHPIGGKTQLMTLSKNTGSFVFLGVVIAPGHTHGLLIPEDAITKFKNVIAKEIFTHNAAVNVPPKQVKKVFDGYVNGWVRHYRTICPGHYAEMQPVLNTYIAEHLANRKRWWRTLLEEDPDYFQLP